MVIYLGENKEEKCFYVGKTCRSINKRLNEHKRKYKVDAKNNKLYNYIKKYGWDSFEWKVVAEYKTKNDLSLAEIEWLDWYKKHLPDWDCLNTAPAGNGGQGAMTEETKNKLRGRKLSDITKKKMSISRMGNKNPMYGKKNPYLSQLMKGNNHRLGKTGYWKGRNNPEHAKRMKGENSPFAKNVLLISPNGTKYQMKSYKQFCKDNHLSSSGICGVLRGNLKHLKGWTGKYLSNGVDNG
jgi:group I intron endonuclease